jgi:hypothetical protein
MVNGTRNSLVNKPGQKLKNGATLLVESEPIMVDGSTTADPKLVRWSIVLCLADGSFRPFVTWERIVGWEQIADGSYNLIDYCVSGGYHRTLDNAMRDFDQREAEFHARLSSRAVVTT